MRALAVTGEQRSPAFPDLPTVAEAGVPGYAAPTWSGVIAPAGMPRPIVDKLNAAINRAIASPASRSASPRSATSRPAARRRNSPRDRVATPRKWGEVIKRAGIKFE